MLPTATPGRASIPSPIPRLNRPRTIAELAALSQINTDDNRNLKYWLRLGSDIRDAGYSFADNGDLESAFVQLARSAKIVLEKLPEHPDYDILTPEQRRVLGLVSLECQ